MSDFNNEKVKKFASGWEFQHKTTSPYYPRSNGLAKRYVGIIKSVLNKASATKTDQHLALLNCGDTAIIDGKSPSQLLNGRKLLTNLPVQPEQLKPTIETGAHRGRREMTSQILQQPRQTSSLTPNSSIVVWREY